MGFISLKPDEIFGPGNGAIAAFVICNACGFFFRDRWKGIFSILLGLAIAEAIVLYGIGSKPEQGLLVWVVGALNGFLALVTADIVSKVTANVDRMVRAKPGLMSAF